ncbi:radical SAM protein [Patescibacteria group bacterium]
MPNKSVVQPNKGYSKYVKFVKFGDSLCVFNTLSLDKIYFKHVDKREILSRHQSLLARKNMLVSFDLAASNFISKKRLGSTPKFEQLYLIISEQCNFRCKYCRQVQPGEWPRESMSYAEAKRIVDEFFVAAERNVRGVVFYGGEPLLNKWVFVKIVPYLRAQEKKRGLDPIDITLITNGTKVDSDITQVIRENSVYVILSLDGPRKFHNKFRVYRDGSGTFVDAVAGLKKLQRDDCKVGISCTVGSHNVSHLKEVFSFFRELRPLNVGISLPHDGEQNPLNKNTGIKEFCEELFHLLDEAKPGDLYIEHIVRKLRLLFSQEIKLNDCAACGGRLVALPKERFGICEGAIGRPGFFSADKGHAMSRSREWYLTSPLFDKKCESCLALGVCGGGCPFDGYLREAKVGARDPRRCYFMKHVVRWGLEEFSETIGERLQEVGYFSPSIRDQFNFLRVRKYITNNLPLRSTTDFNKTKYASSNN